MGIKFSCPACGSTLNVKSEMAGKRGRCPKCQAKIEIPAEDAATDSEPSGPSAAPASEPGPRATPAPERPTSGAVVGSASSVAEETKVRPAPQTPAGDPISEAPTQQWYAMPPGAANQYGPATGEEFRAWMQEGRIPAEALVWRQDWPDWKRAGSVFPELATTAPPAPAAASIPTALPTTALPTPTGVAPAPPPGIVQAPIAQAPIAQAAFLPPGATPGMFPTAQASAPVADGFPMMPTEPATTRGTVGRGRPYRPRSNKGPIVAIVVLLLAMIPLSYFVWKVVTEQIVSPPPSQATSSAGNSAPDNAEAEPPPDDSDEAAGSNEPDE